MAGAFWWGWDAWVDPHREASRLMSVGSGDTLNDNAASSHLLTVIPFCVIYLLTAKERWKRGLALVALPFVVNTVILCNSRGATLGMVAALGAALLLVRRGYRMRMVVAGIATVGVLFALADKQFIARQQTTTNYEEDSSAQQRIMSWKGAFRLIKDRPWGAGGRGFHLLSPIYIPEIVAAHKGDLRAPHNTWAMAASEWGVAGFVCYIGIYASAFLTLRRIKRGAHPDEQGFYYWRAFAIQLALIGHLVSSTFTDRFYGEAGYWMVALSYALYRVQLTEQEERALAPVAEEASAEGPSGVPPRMSEVYG
jgi:O-antigen ligase